MKTNQVKHAKYLKYKWAKKTQDKARRLDRRAKEEQQKDV